MRRITTSLRLCTTGGKINSDDLINFTPLPDINKEDEQILSKNNEYLTGEHDRLIYNHNHQQVHFDTADLDKIVENGEKKKNLKEVHLLKYLISKITEESALIPKNGFFVNYDDKFEFDQECLIEKEKCKDLDNFVFFAKPSQENIDHYLSLKDQDPGISFLKPVIQKNLFKLSSDITQSSYYISNMAWPGSLSYFRPGSPDYGFLYFGWGIKNKDISFLLS